MNPTITITQLQELLDNDKLIILDASMASPGQKDFEPPKQGIPGARYIDIKKEFSDTSCELPNTMLAGRDFENKAQELGINRDSLIVVYDYKGVYSSPRVWWMFKQMGHEHIAVLDGGLPAWQAAGYPLEKIAQPPFVKGDFKASPIPSHIKTQEQVFASIHDEDSQIIDARSSARFHAEVPEPRAGLRGGHIPNSVNIPVSEVVENGHFLPKNELKKVFASKNIKPNQNLIFTCGSGITASVINLAAAIVGYHERAVYDGSWSEWGKPSKYPVV